MNLSANTKFSAYLQKSTLLHIAVVGAFFIAGYIASMNLLNIKKHNIKLLEKSIRVDMVAMPSATMQELKTIKMNDFSKEPQKKIAAPAPKDIIKKNDIVFKKKVKKKSFMDMLKAVKKNNKVLHKKKNLKGNVNTDGKSKKEIEEYNKLVLMGNQLSNGNSATGEVNEGDVDALNSYATQLVLKIKPLWRLPAYLLSKNLTCRVRVFLASSGRLIKAEIFESSGNSEYDKKALNTVQKASPYPNIPAEIRRSALRGNIILGFPL